MITANHLQHLVIITATLRFIKENVKTKELGNVTQVQLQSLQQNVNAYRVTIKELHRTTEYVRNFYNSNYVYLSISFNFSYLLLVPQKILYI